MKRLQDIETNKVISCMDNSRTIEPCHYNDLIRTSRILPPGITQIPNIRVIQIADNGKILETWFIDRKTQEIREHLKEEEAALLHSLVYNQYNETRFEANFPERRNIDLDHIHTGDQESCEPSQIMLRGDELELFLFHSYKEWQTIALPGYLSLVTPEARESFRQLILQKYPQN